MMELSDEAYEQIFVDKWSHAEKKGKANRKCLVLGDHFIFQVHRCIQKENVVVFIKPSCKQNFIHANLAKRLQVPAKNIQNTQVDDENAQFV